MSVRRFFATAGLVLIACVATPSKASADWLLTPFVGWNWGGTANFTIVCQVDVSRCSLPHFDGDDFQQRVMFGASLGWMGAGVAGFEMDFGYSPNFFEHAAGSGNYDFGDSSVTTLMGNILLGVPLGGQHGFGFRPYVVGGVGIIQSRLGNDGSLLKLHVDATDWGFNVGAGAMFFFSDRFGLRGDVRYFRSLQDNEPDDEFDVAFGDFRFWRGTAGVTIRF
jgi:opacity protein-like surface antigen